MDIKSAKLIKGLEFFLIRFATIYRLALSSRDCHALVLSHSFKFPLTNDRDAMIKNNLRSGGRFPLFSLPLTLALTNERLIAGWIRNSESHLKK